MTVSLDAWLILGALLFAVGLAGVLTRRNAILTLVSVEIMMNAANLNFVAFWRYGELDVAAHLFVLFAIVIAGAESAVGLALVIAVFRHFKSTRIDALRTLKG
jgi:NADH:ubiquinone oxidoreductase subunit K